jgi:hypothetical protein
MSDSKVLRYVRSLFGLSVVFATSKGMCLQVLRPDRKAVHWFGRFGYYIYGDAAYPLRSWLLVGFRNAPNEEQEKFNTLGSKARVIVECAFGKLKGQWRCLMNGL